ncbi:MAG: hypothetical protein K6G11_02465 [Lachnospiraceae bacterium]|nr:hypothetical protein [Lachnospiraceae bacterium]
MKEIDNNHVVELNENELPNLLDGEQSLAPIENMKEFENISKNDLYVPVNEYLNTVISQLPADQRNYYENDFEPTSIAIDSVDDDSLLNQTYVQSEYTSSSFRTTRRMYKVMNESTKKEYISIGKKAYEELDKVMDEHTKDAEASADGLLEREVLKCGGLKQFKRSLDGFTDNYISYKTPFMDGVKSINACTAISCGNNIKDKISKYNKDFPIYSLLVKGESSLDDFINYWKDKESGHLNEEKEEFYRNNIYSDCSEILNYADKIEAKLINPVEHEKLDKSGIFDTKNKPFHIYSLSHRGMGPLISSCTAYKDGLKNGWPIDDLGLVAGFKGILDSCKALYISNGEDDLKRFTLYSPKELKEKAKNNPNEKNKQDFYDKLSKAYSNFQETPLKSKKDRLNIINTMHNLVQEGFKKGYINNKNQVSNFENIYQQVNVRTALIERGKEPAFHKPVNTDKLSFDATINNMMNTFNSKRSAFFAMSGESDEHKNLREATEAIIGQDKKYPKDSVYSEDKKERINYVDSLENYSEDYFEKLDYIILQSKKYQKENPDPNTPAGKERLKGAKEIEAFAKKEQLKILEDLKEQIPDLYPNNTIEDYRFLTASKKMYTSLEKIKNMDELPGDNKGKAELFDDAINIMVGRFANSNTESVKQLFNNLGAKGLADELRNSKEFKTLCNSYLKDKTMTPQKLMNELYTGKAVDKLKKIQQKNKSFEKKDTKSAYTKDKEAKEQVAKKQAAKKQAVKGK